MPDKIRLSGRLAPRLAVSVLVLGPGLARAQNSPSSPPATRPGARTTAPAPRPAAPATAPTPRPAAPAARKATPPETPAPAARPLARWKPTGEIVYRRLDPVPLPARTHVYHERTSDEDQLRAEKLFKLGNRKFEQRDLDEAIRLYRRAYQVWPHPRILFNIATNLGYLSNPLESARKFRKVLRYAPGPLQRHRYNEAVKTYRRLMRQLATIRVICQEKNARVFVDGEAVGSAPIDKTVTVLYGRHLVSAKLSGKVPYSAEVNIMRGHQAVVTVVMKDFADVVRYKTVARYRWYWPAATTALATVALAVGAGLWMWGRTSILDLKDQISSDFTSVKGPVTYPTGTENRAVDFQHAGQVMVGLGLGAAAAAVTLWLLRTKRVRYTLEAAPSTGVPGVKIRF